MRKKIIQLPRGYISYSQKELWKASPERYAKVYFENLTPAPNSGQEYGKVVAEALEHSKETGDLLTDSAMLLLPKYDVRDQEIKTFLKTKEGEITVLGRPDMLNSTTKEFREIKTGKIAWTARKAQGHPQMRFYAMLIFLAYKVQLHDAYLDWIETEDTPKGIKPTGRVESFKVAFGMSDILNEMAETSKVAKEIEVAFASYIPDKKLQW